MRDNEMMAYLNSQSGREQFYSEHYDQAISIMKYIGFTEQVLFLILCWRFLSLL